MSVKLAQLEHLVLVRGSIPTLDWIREFPTLRHVGLGAVRGVNDATLSALDQLTALEWLQLYKLPHVTRFPEFRDSGLVRVELESMSGLRSIDAIDDLKFCRSLRELEVISSRLPADAFRPLVSHPSLVAATIGLGSARKNQEVDQMLGVSRASAASQFERRHFQDH